MLERDNNVTFDMNSRINLIKWYMIKWKRIALLEDDVLEARKIAQEMEDQHFNLKGEFEKLKEEYQILQDDYTSQQQIANDIKYI